MTAEEFYQQHALKQPVEFETLEQGDGKLSARPSESEYALHWLAQEGIRGALLDVGCGPLRLLQAARGRFQQRVGLDIAGMAVWEQHPDISTQIADLDKGPLPFGDASFDAVTCLMVIEHVFDPYHAVRELRRVCKPAGRVVIGVPNLVGIKRRLEILLGRLPITSTQHSFDSGAWDGFHLHNFTKGSLDWLLRKEGLQPIRWAAQGAFPWFKQRFHSLLGNDLIVMASRAEPQPDLPFRN